jgi:ectoine hydroxylase-related dioxygenase (phytanoyl-CoA dioxygenase family)
VLYINLAENDGISFHRNEDNLWHELLPAEENYFNAKRYFINTAVGDILLFPSHVRHGVREVSDPIERVSLSFNSFFEGELGNKEFATAVKISLS